MAADERVARVAATIRAHLGTGDIAPDDPALVAFVDAPATGLLAAALVGGGGGAVVLANDLGAVQGAGLVFFKTRPEALTPVLHAKQSKEGRKEEEERKKERKKLR